VRPGIGTVMDDAKFDRLARAFAKTVSRRWLLALFGAMIGMLGQRVARGSQLGPATCGEEGAVCTLLSGCCDGLTCATSAINTSYGICVPGEGGMVSTGTTLISPFSETAVDEVSALVETASTAPTTDPQAEQEARIAEIRARKDAKSSKRKTRLDTKRSNQQTRKDEQRDRRLDEREAEEDALEEALGPQLQLELVRSTQNDASPTATDEVRVETVKVTNLDDVIIVLTRIESLLAPQDGQSLTTAPSRFTLAPGETYFFVAGLPVADATNVRFDWTPEIACGGDPGAGFLVKAAFSVNSDNHDFAIRCDGPNVTSFIETPAEEPPRKRKKSNDRKRKRNNQHQKKKR
jgi:hypothetical protein